MDKNTQKIASAILIVVGTCLWLFSFYVGFQPSDNINVIKNKENQITTSDQHYYNPVTEHLDYEACLSAVHLYYLNLFIKLFYAGLVVILCGLILIWPKMPAYVSFICTSSIYALLIIFDRSVFDFNQKDHMTIHDMWICSSNIMEVIHAKYINLMVYATFFAHCGLFGLNTFFYCIHLLAYLQESRRTNDKILILPKSEDDLTGIEVER